MEEKNSVNKTGWRKRSIRESGGTNRQEEKTVVKTDLHTFLVVSNYGIFWN